MISKTGTFGKILKYTILAGAVLLFVVCLLIILLTIPPGEKYLKGVIEEQVSQSIGLDFRIGSFETNIFSRLVLDSITVANPDDSLGSKPLQVQRIYAGYNIWGLLHHRIDIDSLSIESMQVHLNRDNNKRFNIPLLDSIINDTSGPTGKEENNYNIKLGTASVTNSRVALSDKSLPGEFTLDGIRIDISSSGENSYDAEISIDDIQAIYDTLPAVQSAMKMTGRLDDGRISIEPFLMKIENELTIRGKSTIGLDDDSTLAAEISINGDIDSFYEKYGRIFDLPEVTFKDSLQMLVTVDGKINDPRMKLSCILPEMEYDDIAVKNGRLDAVYSGSRLSIDSLVLSAFDGAISSNGSINLDSIFETSITFNMDRVSLGQLWKTIYHERSPYQGIINGHLNLNGRGHEYSNYAMAADMAVSSFAYQDQPLPDMNFRADYNHNLLQLDINHELFDVRSEITIKDSVVNGQYFIDITELEPLAGMFNIEELSGSLKATGDINGKISNPEFTSRISANGINYNNIPVDTFYADVAYDNSGIKIIRSLFRGAMKITDNKSAPYNIDSVFGYAEYDAELAGSPEDLNGYFSLWIDSAGYGNYTLDSFNVFLNMTGQKVEIDSSTAYVGNLFSKLNGSFNISELSGNILVKTSYYDSTSMPDDSEKYEEVIKDAGDIGLGFDLSDSADYSVNVEGTRIVLSPFIKYINDSLDMHGLIDFSSELSGTPEDPSISLSGHIDSLFIDNVPLDSINTRINLTSNKLNLDELHIFGFGQDLIMSGSAALEPDSITIYRIADTSPLTGTIESKGFDLSILNPFLPYPYEAGGLFTLNMNLSGDYVSPKLSGTISLDSGMVSLGPDYRNFSNISLDAVIQDTILTLNDFNGIIDKYPFDIKGTLMLSGWTTIKTDITADFKSYGQILASGELSDKKYDLDLVLDTLDLSVFNHMTPGFTQLSGLARSDIHIGGSPTDPEIDGKLAINKLAFKHEMVPSQFTDGTVNIDFDKNKIRFSNTRVRLGGGNISLNGTLDHDLLKITDVNLRLQADSLSLNEPKKYLINVRSAVLTYTKSGENFLLDGDIELGESRLLHGFRPQSIMPWAQSVEQTQVELPEFLMQTNVNVRIRESDQLWIDNNLARMRLRAELGIIGNPYKPNLSGRVKIEEGYFLYLDRKFKIEKGDIYFYDPSKFNPEIDLLASTNVTAYQGIQSIPYTVTFSAKGLLDELKVELYSDPQLEKSDIVSLLTFGSTRSQLTGKNADTKGVLKERAQMLTSQRISSYISKKAGSFLGLDEMSVQGNLFQMNRNGGPQVTAAKKISSKAKITYSTTVGYLNDQSIRLDYYLSDRFSIMGQTDREGASSIDLKYSIRFK